MATEKDGGKVEEATVTSGTEGELKARMSGLNRTVEELESGKRLPKALQDQGWRMVDGKIVPPATAAAPTAQPAAPEPRRQAIPAQMPMRRNYFDRATGEVDEGRYEADLANWMQATREIDNAELLATFEHRQATRDMGAAREAALKRLPEKLVNRMGAERVRQMVDLEAQRLAGGAVPTPEQVEQAAQWVRESAEALSEAGAAEAAAETARAAAEHPRDLPPSSPTAAPSTGGGGAGATPIDAARAKAQAALRAKRGGTA